MACTVTFPGLANLSRPRALLLVALAWAAIYLPALGSLEIKGEEGRRLLPAVSMLEPGRWIVPSVGGVPYLSKPPLINWLAAGSFRLAGNRSEWAARAPSAVAVLALALVAVGSLSAWLTPAGAMLAAIFLLTNIGLMEKGRLAEIEALYLSLYGIALLIWLGAWRREADTPGARPTWRAWTLPWVFLGLGLLTKGPLHLVFFYVVVLAILWCVGRMRDLWNWPHLAGVVLMLAIFGAWGVPYLQQVAAHRGGGVWLAQFQNRLEVNEGFQFKLWALNIPRGLANFVPWVVMVPLWWRRGVGGTDGTIDRAVLRGGRFAVTACFLAVSLAPGGQPRYTMPLLVPACVLLALILGNCRATGPVAAFRNDPSEEGGRGADSNPNAGTRQAVRPPYNHLLTVWNCVTMVCLLLVNFASVGLIFHESNHRELGGALAACLVAIVAGLTFRYLNVWWSHLSPPTLGLASALVMALITADFAIGAVPKFRRAEIMRPMAAEIEAAVPSDEPLAVLRPGFLPYLYYLRPGLVYVQRIEDLPATAHYVLVRQDELTNIETTLHERRDTYRIDLRVKDKRLKNDPRARWLLLRLNPLPEPSL